jgi:SAM-dependent methyltransferase
MSADHALYDAKVLYDTKTEAYFDFPRREIAPLLPDRMDRVLEIGCGVGATFKWLRGVGRVQYGVGIDLFPDAAERARSVFDVALSGDIEKMELPEGKFDLIIALDVLEHLVDPWLVIKRLTSILNPGGAMIVSIPNIGHYSVCVPLLLRGQWSYAEDGLLDRTHLRFFNRRTAIELVTSAGLIMDKLELTRRGPRFRSAKARWYSLKLLSRVLPAHLLDWQFLIRAKAV